jgi:hypothetical protein
VTDVIPRKARNEMQNYWLKTFFTREVVVVKNVEFFKLCLCFWYGVNMCVLLIIETFR